MQLLEQIATGKLPNKSLANVIQLKFNKEARKVADNILKLVKDTGLPHISGLTEYDNAKLAFEEILKDKKLNDISFPIVDVKNPDLMNNYVRAMGYGNEDETSSDKSVTKTYTKDTGDCIIGVYVICEKVKKSQIGFLSVGMSYFPYKD